MTVAAKEQSGRAGFIVVARQDEFGPGRPGAEGIEDLKFQDLKGGEQNQNQKWKKQKADRMDDATRTELLLIIVIGELQIWPALRA